MKKIFITGESGTIPLAMQRCAKDYGFEVVNSQIDDKYNLKKLKTHQSFKIREPELDFLDKDLLNKKLEKIWKKTDYIVHSGAFVGTDYCKSSPEAAIKTNVEGTFNIVEIANRYNIPLIYFSTTAIFNPKDYGFGIPMSEDTDIKPQTLYGITKYSGEQIVQRLCKSKHLVVRPVFGFGNYPDDLHSALTKYIYTLYYNSINEKRKNLEILLDFHILKSYTRVENIANVVYTLIKSKKTQWNDDYNVGENFPLGLDWVDLTEKIKNGFEPLKIKFTKNIKFTRKSDYLHYHLMDDKKIKSIGCSFDDLKNYISIDDGIKMTIESVIKNIKEEPYWL